MATSPISSSFPFMRNVSCVTDHASGGASGVFFVITFADVADEGAEFPAARGVVKISIRRGGRSVTAGRCHAAVAL